MQNNNGLNENEERKKIKLVLCLVIICFFQTVMICSIVLGLFIDDFSESTRTFAPFIVSTLGLSIFMLIGLKKKR